MSPRRPVSPVPDRVRWALEVLDPRPEDDILEIGCGPGVAAALICERLTTGRMLAVDRSPVAVRRSAQRHAAHLASGRLSVREAALEALVLPPGSFDKVFSINVNLFWVRRPDRELALLSRALRSDGVLHLLYGAAGPTAADRVAATVSTTLRDCGFADVKVVEGELGTGVSARPPAWAAG